MKIEQLVRAWIRGSRKPFRALFVDPGLGGTGLAVWDMSPKLMLDGSFLDRHDVITIKGGDWRVRLQEIGAEFADYMTEHMPDVVVIEWPQLWSNDERSQAAAASGALFKLVALCGGLLCCCGAANVDALTPFPIDWKGNLNKRAVRLRIARAMPDVGRVPNHAEDAVAMGLAAMGAL